MSVSPTIGQLECVTYQCYFINVLFDILPLSHIISKKKKKKLLKKKKKKKKQIVYMEEKKLYMPLRPRLPYLV